MSNFFNEDQLLLRESIRRFMDEEVRPRALEIDKTHDFPMDLYKRCAELELTGITVPTEYGGMGGDMTTELMLMEELGRACPALGLIVDVNYYCMGTLLDKASPEQKQKYLPKMVTGEIIGAISSTEPPGSSNQREWGIGAVRDGDYYIVNTSKIFCTSSRYFGVVVLAVMTPEGPIKLIIDRETPGLSSGHVEHKMGLHGSDSGTLVLKDVRVPAANAIPYMGGSRSIIPFMDVGAVCLGVAQEAFDKTYAYLSQRSKCGGIITQVGYVGVELAKIATEIELARNMVYSAGRMVEEDKPAQKQAAICKGWISEMAIRTVSRCIELSGNVGYIEETGLSKMLRDVQGLAIAEGSTGLQQMTVQLALGIKPLLLM